MASRKKKYPQKSIGGLSLASVWSKKILVTAYCERFQICVDSFTLFGIILKDTTVVLKLSECWKRFVKIYWELELLNLFAMNSPKILQRKFHRSKIQVKFKKSSNIDNSNAIVMLQVKCFARPHPPSQVQLKLFLSQHKGKRQLRDFRVANMLRKQTKHKRELLIENCYLMEAK